MAHVPAERCLSIIELLAEDAGSMPLGVIAERVQLPKSAAHRLLTTLVERGWAEQDSDTSFYRLTLRLAILGQRFYAASGIPDSCQPLLDRLAQQSREFARLAIVTGDALVWLTHSQGATGGLLYQPFVTSNTVPLYVTASGKAWLATLASRQAIRSALGDRGFADAGHYGPNAVRSMDALMREVAATARRGYGLAVNEAEPGVTAVAAAIRSGAAGSAVGTVSVAGPSVRMTEARVRELAPGVIACAAEMSNLWPLRPQRIQVVPAPGTPRMGSRDAA